MKTEIEIVSEPIFGNKIECVVLLPYVKVNNIARTRYEYTVADFKKHNAYVEVIHGRCHSVATLKTLEDKKILLNNINAVGDLYTLAKGITVNSCLSLFKSFNLDIDLRKSDLVEMSGLNSSITNLDIFPIGDKYCINNKTISNLDEISILDALRSNTKTSCDSLKMTEYGYIRCNKSYMNEIVFNDKVNSSGAKRCAYEQKRMLRTFRNGKVDTSGSIKNKKSTLHYLNIGSGYCPISSYAIKQLAKGERPKTLSYRDAVNKDDKLAQPINLGTSGKLFILKENKNAVVAGYTESYIDELVNSYWNNEEE